MRITQYLAAAALQVAFVSAAAAQVSDDVVKIGVLNDQSGIYADFSGPGSVVAARLAVEDFGGTVLGKKIEVIAGDHQNKPDIGAAIARRWYDTEQVDLIVDLPTSSVLLAVGEVGREKNKLVIVTTGGTSDFTGKFCAPTNIHWVYDTYGLAVGSAKALKKAGGDSWYFITADYAFGHALERDAAATVKKDGGSVAGSVKHPQGTTDFSSLLLQAQASGAKVIGLANAGADTINSIKQAAEFGLSGGEQKFVGLFTNLTDVHAVGLETGKGLLLTQGFYWDLNDETRAFSKRFAERHGAPPAMGQAGVYSAVLHYLKAIQAAGTDETAAVAAKMKETPVNDFFAKNAQIRADGKLIHDHYLLEVKQPAESKGPWDYLELVRVIPGEEAARPASESECSLLRKQSASVPASE